MEYTTEQKKITKQVIFEDLFHEFLELSSFKSDYFKKCFNDQYESFIESLTNDDLNHFVLARNYFLKYFRGLPSLKNNPLLDDVLSNYLLIILLSLIEGIMQDISFIDPLAFIENKINLRKENEELNNEKVNIWIDEYRNTYGSIRKVKRFFDQFVYPDEKEYISMTYKNGKLISKDFKHIISDLYNIRSKYIHGQGTESLKPRGFVDVLKYDEELGVHFFERQTVLNIYDLTNIVWIGILRKFGMVLPS